MTVMSACMDVGVEKRRNKRPEIPNDVGMEHLAIDEWLDIPFLEIYRMENDIRVARHADFGPHEMGRTINWNTALELTYRYPNPEQL